MYLFHLLENALMFQIVYFVGTRYIYLSMVNKHHHI